MGCDRPHLLPQQRLVHPRTVDLREIVNTLLYLATTGANSGNCRRIFRPLRRFRIIFIDDCGYAGAKLRAALANHGNWHLEIVKRSDHTQGFVLPRRCVVERNFAWLGRYRRLTKDYERTISSATAWLFLSHIKRLTQKIARNEF